MCVLNKQNFCMVWHLAVYLWTANLYKIPISVEKSLSRLLCVNMLPDNCRADIYLSLGLGVVRSFV